MWTCTKCERIFEKVKQPHSCKKVPLDEHFIKKDKEKSIFNYLVKQINEKVGLCKIISLPCCVHLFGKYYFLAALPKKDRLEIRFALDRKLNSPKLKQFVPISSKNYKYCIDIINVEDVDEELMKWLHESYNLKSF